MTGSCRGHGSPRISPRTAAFPSTSTASSAAIRSSMKEARFFLIVRFSIEPQVEAQVLKWLDGGHAAEVLRQPGFLWCKRLRLGAHEFAMLYGIETLEAFDAYEANTALKA